MPFFVTCLCITAVLKLGLRSHMEGIQQECRPHRLTHTVPTLGHTQGESGSTCTPLPSTP